MDGGNGFDIVSFDLGGFATGLNISNRANLNLGVAGSLRNFEAFDDITLGFGNNVDNLVQTADVTVTTYGGSDSITILNASASIYAGYGDDVITTTLGNDYIEGAGGNNTARLGDGDDYYRTGRPFRLPASSRSGARRAAIWC